MTANSWKIKGPWLLSLVGLLIIFFIGVDKIATNGVSDLQQTFNTSWFKWLFRFSVSTFTLSTSFLFLYFVNRLPPNKDYWYRLEHTFQKQNINDAAVDSIVSFTNSLIEDMRNLALELEKLNGKQREEAIMKTVLKLSNTTYKMADMRKSPRIGLIIDTFVDAMEKLAQGHSRELEILLLLKKFRRDENSDFYPVKAS